MTLPTTIHSQSDLLDLWSTLMQPLGFSRHSLSILFIDHDGRPIPHLTEVEDAGPPPPEEEWAGFADLIGSLAAELVPDGRVAFLRCRPGSGGITSDDRAWARSLYETGRLAGVAVEVVHRACDTDLVPIPVDEVLAASA